MKRKEEDQQSNLNYFAECDPNGEGGRLRVLVSGCIAGAAR